jgi:hypothetical protein
MMLAMAHASLRLVLRTLRSVYDFPGEFASTEVLPFSVVRFLHSHLTAQKYLKDLVVASVSSTFSSGQGALQRDMLARIKSPDVFIAGRLARRETVTFTPFERLFGVFSVGNLAVYCATVDYVPGPSPVVEDLTAKALALTFGMRGGPLEFTSFAALKEAPGGPRRGRRPGDLDRPGRAEARPAFQTAFADQKARSDAAHG